MADAVTRNILVVEDELRVRQLVAKVLRRRGYVVLEAEDGEAAMRLFGPDADDIAVLLADVVLPGMSGEELAGSLRALNPVLKVIYMSGYAEADLPRRAAATDGASYVTKPFTPELLTMTVEGVLRQ